MKSVFSVLVVLLLATSVAAAPLPGDNDISGAVSFGMAQGSHTGSLAGNIGYGRYFGKWGENITPQLGLRQGINFAFLDNARDQWIADTQLVGTLNWVQRPDARWVPFIGTGIGGAYNDIGGSGILSPTAGVKIFLDADRGVAGNTYVGLAYQYNWLWDNIRTGQSNDFSNGTHGAFLNIGYAWGSAERPDYKNLYEQCQTKLADCNAALENCEAKFKDCVRK